jgi:hypothetical protein
MGNQSTTEKIFTALDEVADKCNWRPGLIVDIVDIAVFKVISIRATNRGKSHVQFVENNIEEIIYIYTGTRVVDLRADAYEIILHPVVSSKIGGARIDPKKLFNENVESELESKLESELSREFNDVKIKNTKDITVYEDDTIKFDALKSNDNTGNLTVRCAPCSMHFIGGCQTCGKYTTAEFAAAAQDGISDGIILSTSPLDNIIDNIDDDDNNLER